VVGQVTEHLSKRTPSIATGTFWKLPASIGGWGDVTHVHLSKSGVDCNGTVEIKYLSYHIIVWQVGREAALETRHLQAPRFQIPAIKSLQNYLAENGEPRSIYCVGQPPNFERIRRRRAPRRDAVDSAPLAKAQSHSPLAVIHARALCTMAECWLVTNKKPG